MLILLVLFVATGLLFIGLALPLVRRRVRPNGLYGLRVPATFEDETVWYEANARSGRDLLLFGIITVASAVGLPLVPNLTEDAYAISMTVLIVAGALLLCVAGWRRANRLLAERRKEAA